TTPEEATARGTSCSRRGRRAPVAHRTSAASEAETSARPKPIMTGPSSPIAARVAGSVPEKPSTPRAPNSTLSAFRCARPRLPHVAARRARVKRKRSGPAGREAGLLARHAGQARPVPGVAAPGERGEDAVADERGERQGRARVVGGLQRERQILERQRHGESG